ncbi:MAG: hypothetical protein LUE63_08715 [Lachnospiraceae bacterium]|nr:hypothetical protein [Lachnospiraceae bacterium]
MILATKGYDLCSNERGLKFPDLFFCQGKVVPLPWRESMFQSPKCRLAGMIKRRIMRIKITKLRQKLAEQKNQYWENRKQTLSETFTPPACRGLSPKEEEAIIGEVLQQLEKIRLEATGEMSEEACLDLLSERLAALLEESGEAWDLALRDARVRRALLSPGLPTASPSSRARR